MIFNDIDCYVHSPSKKLWSPLQTLDDLPLSHPEHFSTPVMKSGKRRHGDGLVFFKQCPQHFYPQVHVDNQIKFFMEFQERRWNEYMEVNLLGLSSVQMLKNVMSSLIAVIQTLTRTCQMILMTRTMIAGPVIATRVGNTTKDAWLSLWGGSCVWRWRIENALGCGCQCWLSSQAWMRLLSSSPATTCWWSPFGTAKCKLLSVLRTLWKRQQ